MQFDPIILINQRSNFGRAFQYLLHSGVNTDETFKKAAESLKTQGTLL
jgi:hypothetical protein